MSIPVVNNFRKNLQEARIFFSGLAKRVLRINIFTRFKMKATVFGSTGPIGSELVRILSVEHTDWQIKAVSRVSNVVPASFEKLGNVKMATADALSRADVLNACTDADLVYCCIGFPQYERKYWAENWPKIVDNLLAAITPSGSIQSKKLIFCDNLYAYGPSTSINSKSPTLEANLKSKPNIRALVRQKLQAHMDKYPDSIVVVGASDFFGPNITKSMMGETMVGKMTNGESPLALYTCKQVHDMCYGPDFSRALAVLSTRKEAYNRFHIAPHSIHGKTMQEIGDAVMDHIKTGQKAKFFVLPYWLMYLLSFLSTDMAELHEMREFWMNDYTVDDSEIAREFGLKATDPSVAIKACVASFQKKEG